ncbi:MAG TPA: AfsA-related hotdog domain-containing protein [Telmatospirillum sp.]|nr:AfsA-related hotdog domain-containing protein [Telmatospirillum sp.]
MTISQLRGLLDLPAGLILCEKMRLVPGQGLSEKDVDDVLAQATATAHRDRLDFSLWRRTPRRADRALSHKYRIENTLISAPRRIDEDHYDVDLLVDENSELMGDHQTGQHLQGMLMIEAIRQAFMAIAEAFFLPSGDIEYYFLFNTLAVELKRFIFPIATCLHCTILEKDLSGTSRRFVMEALFEQAGSETARISGSFTVAKYRSIKKMEQLLAKETITSHFATLAAADQRSLGEAAHAAAQ